MLEMAFEFENVGREMEVQEVPEIWQLNKVGSGGFFAINSGDEQTT